MILKLIQMQFPDFYDIIFFSANIFFPGKSILKNMSFSSPSDFLGSNKHIFYGTK